ncbi:hypothetical protein [Kamptonema formosum]|uniref:hypothetical protein n=1 Tax=Kamptonema formosum TaxID=331992 RepID=UPI0003454103|nr:hypothetical protein [Oscillatoria sp. PCC 10802]
MEIIPQESLPDLLGTFSLFSQEKIGLKPPPCKLSLPSAPRLMASVFGYEIERFSVR